MNKDKRKDLAKVKVTQVKLFVSVVHGLILQLLRRKMIMLSMPRIFIVVRMNAWRSRFSAFFACVFLCHDEREMNPVGKNGDWKRSERCSRTRREENIRGRKSYSHLVAHSKINRSIMPTVKHDLLLLDQHVLNTGPHHRHPLPKYLGSF